MLKNQQEIIRALHKHFFRSRKSIKANIADALDLFAGYNHGLQRP